MKLSKQEAELYYELMWALQFFVNQRLNLLPSVNTLKDYAICTAEEKFKVRKALFENKKWFDLFVKENPQQFSEDNLSIIKSWQNFIRGEFYIERFLKKQAIFIAQDNRVFGVCGILDGFDEMIHPSNLPLLVRTVLLPFSGRIIYDGLFEPYSVMFGSGIRGDLKETYLRAKQKNRIIESFDEPIKPRPTKAKLLKNWEPDISSLLEKTKQLKAGSDDPATYGSSFSLVKASLEYAQSVVSQSDSNTLFKRLTKLEKELNKAFVTLEREEG